MNDPTLAAPNGGAVSRLGRPGATRMSPPTLAPLAAPQGVDQSFGAALRD